MLNALLGLLAGVLLAWLFLRTKLSVVSKELTISERTREAAQIGLGEQQRINTELRAEIAGLKTELENEKRGGEEKVKLLNDARVEMERTFRSLASDALQNNNQSFLDLAKTHLGTFQTEARSDLDTRKTAIEGLLRPINESLKQVDGQLQKLETARVDAYSSLLTQVKQLATTETNLRDETASLVRALRSPVVRGRWGEIQLRRVVEMAGMLSYCDFIEQQTVNTPDGRLRPDLIVRLPGGKQVVVDAKTPLDAYMDSVSCSEEVLRKQLLQKHATQVRAQLTRLSSKAYWDQFDASPEFVVMFLPGEAFFSAALEQQPTLIEEGVNQRVIPASPTTLIALLRAVAYGWRQESLEQNAKTISDLGKDLYDRLRKMTEHFQNLGKNLNRAVDAYNSAVSSLESRVLVSARRFAELGTSVRDEIPQAEQIESVTRNLALEWDEPVDPDDSDEGDPQLSNEAGA